jgi:hypothetical protein
VPHRNRVTPFAEVIETPARGLLYGNRGVLHDDEGRIVRNWQVKRWIACVLEFKGRRRPLLRPGRFTELFFLDEATAFAAGHRPCAECRRADFNRFREAWAETHPGASLRVDDIDRVLHAERVASDRTKRLHEATLGDLPDGSMIADGEQALLLRDNQLLAWSPFGYEHRRPAALASASVQVLTPPSIVDVIRSGYTPSIHPTAGGARDDLR